MQDREDLDNPPFQGTDLNTTFNNTTSALQLTDPSVVVTGTYSQSGTTITITSNGHGIAAGETLQFNFTSGDAVSGLYTVVQSFSQTFTVTAAKSATTSGNVSIDRGLRGEYQFLNILDLGAVFSLDLKRVIRSVGFLIGQDIETLIPSGSFWDDYAIDGNFDGAAADEANCQVQVATSQAGSGAFGPFNNFANGTFRGRRFKFRLVLETTNTAQNMNVQQAGYTAEFQARTEQNYQTGSGTSTAPQSSGTSSSGKTVTFGSPFFVGTTALGGANAFLPTIGITIQNAQSGDFFTVTSVSGTGFTVTIKNGSSFVDRSFTFSAVGYGKGV